MHFLKFTCYSNIGLLMHRYCRSEFSLNHIYKPMKSVPIKITKVGQYPISTQVDLLVQKSGVLTKTSFVRHPSDCHTVYDYRSFHVSSERKAPLALVLSIIRNGMKLGAILMGRRMRTWWRDLPMSRKTEIIDNLWKNALLLSALLALVTTGIVCFYFSHLENDPITKRRRFIALNKKQMAELTRPEEELLTREFQEFILPPSHPTCKRVILVTERILAANRDVSEVRNREWVLNVIDRPDIRNAFVLPNGAIYLFTGLLDLCRNDDQLGIVLCHEISHALLRHLAEQLSLLYFGEILFLVPIFVIWSILPDYAAIFAHLFAKLFTNLVFHLPFSRFAEIEADGLGLNLAARACFDVREAGAFWKKMRLLTGYKAARIIKQNVEWFSTHPSYKSRERFLDTLMPFAIHLRKTCNCPELSENDPRKNMPAILQDLIDILKKLDSNPKV